ncbi:Putative Guanine nucleotide-binding protein subunit gamma, other [Rhizopus microsporus]|nr:Putative Guanine nucleotide-binding protein subunit gamma, other [Rhizopus microsporus]
MPTKLQPRARPRKTPKMTETRLRRLEEYNNYLRSQLNISRITVSEASASLIDYCNNNKDPLLPSIWGPVPKNEDPFAPPESGQCCTIM